MKIKSQFIFLGLISTSILAWHFYPSEYDQLMNKVIREQMSHSEVKLFDGEIEPPIPDKSKNNETILGIDSNNNGIRDDIDIWINRTAIDYNERMGMRQYARSIQDTLRVCSQRLDSEIVTALTVKANSSTCLSAISD